MQRNLLKTLPLVNKYETICENTIMLTNVRWRKRRWAPVNPSKKFFVPVKPEQNPEEKAELKIRTPRYKTTMKALTYVNPFRLIYLGIASSKSEILPFSFRPLQYCGCT